MKDWKLYNEQNFVKVVYSMSVGPERISEEKFEKNKKPRYYKKHANFLGMKVIGVNISEPYNVKMYSKNENIEGLNGIITALEVGIKNNENLRFLKLHWDYVDNRFPKNKLRQKLNGYYFRDGKPAEFQTLFSLYDQWPTDYPKVMTNQMAKKLESFLQGDRGSKLWDDIVLSFSHLIHPGPEYNDQNIEKIKRQYILLE